jgi:hypothetical protein
MGKPMGRHPNPITQYQKPKKGSISCDLHFVLCSSFDRLSKSKIGQHDQESPKTWSRDNTNQGRHGLLCQGKEDHQG